MNIKGYKIYKYKGMYKGSIRHIQKQETEETGTIKYRVSKYLYKNLETRN